MKLAFRMILSGLLVCLLQPAIIAQKLLVPGDSAPDIIGWPSEDKMETVEWEGLTLVNFWGTWCAPCKKEMPSLQKIWEERAADGFRVIGVVPNRRQKREVIQAYLDEVGVKYEVFQLPDRFAKPWASVGIFPTSFLIDENGQILRRYVGALPVQTEGMLRDINAVLDGQPLPEQVIVNYEDVDLNESSAPAAR